MFFPRMIPGSGDKTLETGPDIFNMVCWAKVPMVVDVEGMFVSKETINAVIALPSVMEDEGRLWLHMVQQEPVRPLLVSLRRNLDDGFVCGPLGHTDQHRLVPMPSPSKPRFIYFDVALEM